MSAKSFPPDETDVDVDHPVSIPMVLGGVGIAVEVPSPEDESDAAVISADETYQATADDRKALIDGFKIRNASNRTWTERRRANADLVGVLSCLLKPPVTEMGFSTHPVGDRLEAEVEITLLAVLGEIRMMATAECRGDDDAEDGEINP